MNATHPNVKYPEAVPPNCPICASLRGRKAIVTDASSGIGLGIAIALGQAGADGVVH